MRSQFIIYVTAGSPPAEVVMDQEEMTPDMYLRWEEDEEEEESCIITRIFLFQGDNKEPDSFQGVPPAS